MIQDSELTELEHWLSQQSSSEFPGYGRVDYWLRYQTVAEYLNREVHPHVEKGALVRGDGYLTDHGPDHVRTIFRRAATLIRIEELNPYEVYLFLMAAHFHDIGNILGRKEHGSHINTVMAKFADLLGDDTVELRAITRIAQAHTGNAVTGEDSISRLTSEEEILHFAVRPQALAALLRFADELADDSQRAARFSLKLGIIPQKSEVYHQYARSLQSVRAYSDTRTISLSFNFTRSEARKKFGKGRRKVFLLDEIYDRSIKLHRERIYCMRFLVPLALFDAIKVTIEIYPSDRHPMRELEIGYRLQETGYPLPPVGIRELCPEIRWAGSTLKEHFDGDS
ncbi:MAG TPA: hypothetical protein VHQ90_11775 [Thermoanaerobaculia bacterium]|nr:hypothetical protein [Thermoanaerobaculia bacterium]